MIQTAISITLNFAKGQYTFDSFNNGEKGIYAWANKNDYWDRNRAETTMSRFVTTFTDRLTSRNVKSQKNEIILKCHILNTFMAVNGNLQDSAA